MKKVFISKNYRDPFTASSKAKIDAETIMKNLHYENIGLPKKNFENQIIGNLWTLASNLLAFLRIPSKGIVFLQYPTHFVGKIKNWSRYRKNYIILLIHDLNCLRNQRDFLDINMLGTAHYLIVHTLAMKQWLLAHGISTENHIIVLEIFDYLNNSTEDTLIRQKTDNTYQIAYAGNLMKSRFLNKVSFSSIAMNVYGSGGELLSLKNGVYYKGCFLPEELGRHLEEDFGLVWDGDDDVTCTESNGNYLRYNAPHKLSLYLSNGLPVIVWGQSAMAPFVKTNGIGITIESLCEIETKLNSTSFEEYNLMARNAAAMARRLRTGYYLSKAIGVITNSIQSQNIS